MFHKSYFLKSPFLIQRASLYSSRTFTCTLVPPQSAIRGRPTAACVRTRALSAPPCLSSLIHFSPSKIFPSTSVPTIKSLLERFISNTNHLLQDDFFNKKPCRHILSLIDTLHICTLCCNYLNFLLSLSLNQF